MGSTTDTITFNVNKEQSIADNASGQNVGNGNDDHAIVGKSSNGWTWADLIRAPISFGSSSDYPGGLRLSKAELWMKTTSETHTGRGGSPRSQLRRLDASFTASGGGENSWGTTYGTVWGEEQVRGSEYDLGATADSDGVLEKMDCTVPFGQWLPTWMQKPDGSAGGGETNHGCRISSYDDSTTSRTQEFYSMRGSYVPRFVVTVKVGKKPGAPTLAGPSGVVSAAPTSFVATAVETPVSKYAIQVSTDPTFAVVDLWNASGLTAGISGATVTATYAGSTQPGGVPIYWRIRTANDLGVYGDYADAQTYTIQTLGTVSFDWPTADGPVRLWNLGEEVEWTDLGSHGKPQITVKYVDATGTPASLLRVEMFTDAGVLEHTQDFTGTFTPGVANELNIDKALVRASFHKVQVTPFIGSTPQATSAQRRFKVQWGQGIYAVSPSPGAASSGWRFVYDAVTGAEARVAFLHRSKDGGVTGPWKASLGAVTVRLNWDILVRLGTRSAMPALPKMQAFWTPSSATAPDHWTGVNCAISLDDSFRRFGVKSLKIITLPSTQGHIKPFIEPGVEGLIVSGDTTYTLSIFVHSMGRTLNAPVRLAVLDPTGAVIWDPEAVPGTDPDASTDDTGHAREGWERIYTTFQTPPGQERVVPILRVGGGAAEEFRVDAAQLEEGTYASLWTPGLLGPASIIDKGGLMVDATRGGTFRLKGLSGGVRDIIDLYQHGLRYAGDTELSSPSVGVMAINGASFGPNAPLVGAYGTAIGTNNNVASGTVGELGFGVAAVDPLGYRQSSGRLLIPVGRGGLYRIDLCVELSAPAGTASTAGHLTEVRLLPGGEPLGIVPRYDTGNVLGATFSAFRVLADAAEVYVTVQPRASASATSRIRSWAITRLGSGYA